MPDMWLPYPRRELIARGRSVWHSELDPAASKVLACSEWEPL